jgi:putative ABC transport system permease protein
MEAINISYQAIIILYALITVPVLICLFLKLGNVKQILIAVLRMTVQLAAMGLYLDYLFRYNNVWVNFGWVPSLSSSSSSLLPSGRNLFTMPAT